MKNDKYAGRSAATGLRVLKPYRAPRSKAKRAETLWEVPVNPDGWADWVHPLPGYRIQCCDCGLIHEMEFAIVPRTQNAPLNDGEDDEHVVVFRMRRPALAAGSRRAKTAKLAECEASQSGPKGNAQNE